MAGDDDWKKKVDAQKTNSERGGVLHQRRKLPYSPYTMALGGFLIAAGIGYVVLYSKKKPEASAADVARVATNTANPEDTRPRK